MSDRQDAAMQKAFERGQEAWREGKSQGDNPYPEVSPYHDYWDQGWVAEYGIHHD